MMKKIAFVMAAAAFAVPAAAAPGDTATGQGVASAEVVAPISITHDTGASLSFGTITAGGGGSVVVNRNGRGSITGEVALVNGASTSADSFTVDGDADRAFTISTTGGTVTSGTDTMSFTTNAPGRGTLDATGTTSFSVGGTLSVAASQAPGDYSGTYDATVTYN